eukprot:7798381-Pyramimonas_sp.AAC.1
MVWMLAPSVKLISLSRRPSGAHAATRLAWSLLALLWWSRWMPMLTCLPTLLWLATLAFVGMAPSSTITGAL